MDDPAVVAAVLAVVYLLVEGGKFILGRAKKADALEQAPTQELPDLKVLEDYLKSCIATKEQLEVLVAEIHESLQSCEAAQSICSEVEKLRNRVDELQELRMSDRDALYERLIDTVHTFSATIQAKLEQPNKLEQSNDPDVPA